MEYVECPNNWLRSLGQLAVFLAGGITGCPDWQTEMVRLLSMTDYTVLNPRRLDFPAGDPGAAEFQVRWEFEHLRKADLISFWFCKETIQPIVLYELGAWSMTDTPIVIGIEPGYARELDVRIQTALVRPAGVPVASTLEDLAREIRDFKPKLLPPFS
jgi:hypothetical protein